MKRFLLIMLALFLTGCGSAATTDAQGEEQKAAEATASDDNNGVVALRIWGAEEDQAMLAQMGESFKEKYAVHLVHLQEVHPYS